MADRIRGSYDDALYKKDVYFTLLFYSCSWDVTVSVGEGMTTVKQSAKI